MKLRVFELMADRGTTQKELSAETGISQGNISDWKNGRSTPKLDALCKMADYFYVSTDYLLGRTDIKEMAKISGNTLKPEEQKLLELYNALPDDITRGRVLGYIDSMLQNVATSANPGERVV